MCKYNRTIYRTVLSVQCVNRRVRSKAYTQPLTDYIVISFVYFGVNYKLRERNDTTQNWSFN